MDRKRHAPENASCVVVFTLIGVRMRQIGDFLLRRSVLPGRGGKAPAGAFPGDRCEAAARQLIVERCDWKNLRVIVKLPFFLEDPVPAVVRRMRTRCAKTT